MDLTTQTSALIEEFFSSAITHVFNENGNKATTESIAISKVSTEMIKWSPNGSTISREFNDMTSLKSEDVTTESMMNAMGPFLQEHVWMGTIYLMVILLLIFIGSVGNLLIIGAYYTEKGLKVVGAEFIVNLAVADFLIVGFAQPMCVLGVVKGQEYFDARPVLCELTGSLCLTACYVAFISLLSVSLNRFFFVCFNHYHNRIYSKRSVGLMCIAIWIVSFGLDLPHFVGLGGHFFDHKSHQCIWNRMVSQAYTIFTITFMLGSLVVMVVMYVFIYRKIRKIQNSVMTEDFSETLQTDINTRTTASLYSPARSQQLGNGGSPSLVRHDTRSNWKTCKTLSVLVIAYVVCWLPYCLVILIDLAHELPTFVHLWATLLAHAHSSINFIIYGATSRRYSEAYDNVICFRAFFKWLEQESSISGAAQQEMYDCNKIRPGGMYELNEESSQGTDKRT